MQLLIYLFLFLFGQYFRTFRLLLETCSCLFQCPPISLKGYFLFILSSCSVWSVSASSGIGGLDSRLPFGGPALLVSVLAVRTHCSLDLSAPLAGSGAEQSGKEAGS